MPLITIKVKLKNGKNLDVQGVPITGRSLLFLHMQRQVIDQLTSRDSLLICPFELTCILISHAPGVMLDIFVAMKYLFVNLFVILRVSSSMEKKLIFTSTVYEVVFFIYL